MKKSLSFLLASILLAQIFLAQTAFAGGSVLYSIPKDVLYFFRISTHHSNPLKQKVEDHLNRLFYHDENIQLFDERTFANLFVVGQGPVPSDAKKLATYYIFTIPEKKLNDYLSALPEGQLTTYGESDPVYHKLGDFYFGSRYNASASGSIMVEMSDNKSAFLNMINQTESIMDSEKFSAVDVPFERGFLEGAFDFEAIKAFDPENPLAMPGLESAWFYAEGDYNSLTGLLTFRYDPLLLPEKLVFSDSFLDNLNLDDLVLYPKNDSSTNGFEKIFATTTLPAGTENDPANPDGKLSFQVGFNREYDFPIPFGCQSLPPYDINSLFRETTNYTFTDIGENSPYYSDIRTLLEHGIIEGYITPQGRYFYPDNEISRAEFTKLALAAQVKQSGSYGDIGPQLYFFDVSPCQWYAPYVNKAYTFGFINGHPDGTFKPHDPITRAEALQELYNALYELRDLSLQDRQPPFTDISTGEWYYKAVKGAYNYGLLESEEKLYPNEYLTRGESAKLLTLFFAK